MGAYPLTLQRKASQLFLMHNVVYARFSVMRNRVLTVFFITFYITVAL